MHSKLCIILNAKEIHCFLAYGSEIYIRVHQNVLVWHKNITEYEVNKLGNVCIG
jgi:hypothetical protein